MNKVTKLDEILPLIADTLSAMQIDLKAQKGEDELIELTRDGLPVYEIWEADTNDSLVVFQGIHYPASYDCPSDYDTRELKTVPNWKHALKLILDRDHDENFSMAVEYALEKSSPNLSGF